MDTVLHVIYSMFMCVCDEREGGRETHVKCYVAVSMLCWCVFIFLSLWACVFYFYLIFALLKLQGSTNLESIQIIKKPGGSLKDSFLDEG